MVRNDITKKERLLLDLIKPIYKKKKVKIQSATLDTRSVVAVALLHHSSQQMHLKAGELANLLVREKEGPRVSLSG